jgi:hypothetical protein
MGYLWINLMQGSMCLEAAAFLRICQITNALNVSQTSIKIAINSITDLSLIVLLG